jgi:glycosyltransferase involved in cell wall biosynthesis
LNPELTVIVCTFNRGHLLSETIPSILQQNISNDLYNVLIVNNNSKDNTNEIISSLIHNYNNVSTINEPQQGLSYARNTGYKTATTKWIIYLDDDAIAPETFIKTALAIAISNEYDCFGGVYYPWYKYGKPVWFKDRYASTAEFYKKAGGHKLQYASGGIMAIKRSILIELNGFPVNLGMKGNTMAYGEETHLQYRMRKRGYTIGIIPNWYINHIVNRYKLKSKWFVKNGYVTGRDTWRTYSEKVTLKLIAKYSLNIFTTLFKNLYKNTKLLFKKNYYIQNWIIETFRPVSIELGRVIGGIKLLLK